MSSSRSVIAASSSEDGGSSSWRRRAHILLVEDSPTDAMMMQEILSHAHFQNTLHLTEDGLQALEFLRKEGAYSAAPRPDLILLDLQLPRKSGQEVLAEIKADEKLRSIPVVVLSSSREDRDISDAYQSFANCYVAKPVDYQDYVAAVQLIERFWLGLAVRTEEG